MVNISSTITYGFVSAFVDEDLDTVWLFGSACNRCPGGRGRCTHGGKVQAWSNRGDKASLLRWDSAPAGGCPATENVEVTRVRSTAAEQQAAGLPPHRYAMILEVEPQRFAINNNVRPAPSVLVRAQVTGPTV